MPSETDQDLVMIAAVAGCIEAMRIGNAFARMDLKQKLDEAFSACENAIITYPGMSSRTWTRQKVQEFRSFINDTPDTGYTNVAMVCMCDRALVDIMEREGGLGRRVELIRPIHDVIHAIHEFCDPAGVNFPAFAKSDELLDGLYRIIGFFTAGEVEEKMKRRRLRKRGAARAACA